MTAVKIMIVARFNQAYPQCQNYSCQIFLKALTCNQWLHVRAFKNTFKNTKPLGLNPNLIELNELKTRVSFFLKLDNGKYCPWISLNFRNMTSSGDVIQIKNAIFKSIISQMIFQKCFISLRRNTPCLFDA